MKTKQLTRAGIIRWTLCLFALLLFSGFVVLAQSPQEESGGPTPPTMDSLAGVDLWVSKVSGTQDPVPGRTVGYYIGFGNSGTDTVRNVIITDELLDGRNCLSWLWDDAAALRMPFERIVSAQRVIWRFDSLPPEYEGTIFVAFNVALNCPACTTLTDTVTISPTDANPGNNTASFSGHQIKIPDLFISKSASSNVVAPGDILTYTITYNNTGCACAEDVWITDMLPSQVDFVSAIPAPADRWDYGLLWRNPMLCRDRPQLIQVAVRVREDLATGTVLTNTVTISSFASIENSPANNRDVVTTTVKRPDVSLNKTCMPTVTACEPLTYVLTYRNTGEVSARDVRIVDNLPQGAIYERASLEPCRVQDREVIWCLPELGPGARGTLTLTVMLDRQQNEGERLVNEAFISSRTPEDDRNNNNVTCSTIVQYADLWVRTICPAPTLPGLPITYYVEFGNQGSAGASNVVLMNVFPVEVTSIAATDAITVTPTRIPPGPGESVYLYRWDMLPPGARGWITFTARIMPTAGAGYAQWNITNTITISTTTCEWRYVNNSSQCLTPVRRSDVSVVKRVEPSTVVTPGAVITFTLIYTNMGAATAEGVVITDVLSYGPVPSCTVIRSYNYEWRLPSVGSRQGGQIITTTTIMTRPCSGVTWPATGWIITNTACITTTTPESSDVSHCSTVTMTVVPGCPISLTLVADPAFLPADGQSSTILTLTARDRYGNPALNGTEVEFTTDHGRFSNGERLLKGTTRDGVIAAVLIADERASVATVQARVVRVPLGCDRADFAVTQPVTFQAAALAVVKTISPPGGAVVPGQRVTYTIVYTNAGPGTATNTVITDTLPSGFMLATVQPAPHNTSEQTHIWRVGNLGARAGGAITITGSFSTHPVESSPRVNACNTVTVTSRTDDPNPRDNVARACLDVLAADLGVAKQAWQIEVNPGGMLRWTIWISNTGQAAAENVMVMDRLPMTTTLHSVSLSNYTYVHPTVTIGVGNLLPNQSVTIALAARVDTTGVTPRQVLTNSAWAMSTTYDYRPANNIATDRGVIVIAPDMRVYIRHEPEATCWGEPITYHVRYENAGNEIATCVRITVTLDPRLQCADGQTSFVFTEAQVPIWGAGEYIIPCSLPTSAGGPLAATARVAVTCGVPDPVPNNDLSQDSATPTSRCRPIRLPIFTKGYQDREAAR